MNVTSLLKNSLTSLSGYSFSWADFTTASVDAAILVESFLAAQSAFYLFDYLYRAYLTVRLVARYWGRGAVQLPKTDLRTHRPEIAQAWFTWTKRLLQWMPFLSLQLLLLAMFVVLIIWSFAGKSVALTGAALHHLTLTRRISISVRRSALCAWLPVLFGILRVPQRQPHLRVSEPELSGLQLRRGRGQRRHRERVDEVQRADRAVLLQQRRQELTSAHRDPEPDGGLQPNPSCEKFSSRPNPSLPNRNPNFAAPLR